MNLEIVDQTVQVPVIMAHTGLMREDVGVRAVRNPAFSVFYPNEPISVLCWEEVWKRIEQRAKKEKNPAVSSHKVQINLMEEALHDPVTYMGIGNAKVRPNWNVHPEWWGTEFHGDWASGSMAKKYMSWGMVRDILAETSLARKAEDQQRFSRAFMSNSRYGAAVLREPRIGVLPEGAQYNGYVVVDGCHLVSRSLVAEIRNAQKSKDPLIYFGKSRQNYMTWQRFDWDVIGDEATDFILENILTSEGSLEWIYRALGDINQKDELVRLNPAMIHHPFVVNSLVNSTKETLLELATTVPLDCSFYTAIPSRTGEWILPKGRWMVGRWPDDSWNSVMGLDVREQSQTEIDWVNDQTAIQASYTSPDWLVKGNAMVVPDELMDGYDIIFCSEDVKVLAHGNLSEWRKKVALHGGVYPMPMPSGWCYFGIVQWWGKGSLLACPVHWTSPSGDDRGFKVMGGDHDGDGVFLSNLDDFPDIWSDLISRPIQPSIKTEKTNSSLDKRARMIACSMGNNIGVATIVNANTFVLGRKARPQLAIDTEWFSSEEEMDAFINYLMKEFSDFKSLNDVGYDKERMFQLNSSVIRIVGRSGGYTNWGRNVWAFVHGIPEFYLDLPQSMKDIVDAGREPAAEMKKDPRWKAHISDYHADATIAHIFAIVRPTLVDWFNSYMIKGVWPIMNAIDVAPLSDFTNWAPQVLKEHLDLAMQHQKRYLASASSVAWEDTSEDGSVRRFSDWWRAECIRWAQEVFVEKLNSTELNAFYALWRVSHMSGGQLSGAGSAFVGFPDRVRELLVDMPGLMTSGDLMTEIVGIAHNFWAVPNKIEGLSVEILEISYKQQTRRVVVSLDDFQGLNNVPGDSRLPRRLIGFIPVMKAVQLRAGFSSPNKGKYLMNAELSKSGNAFIARLRSV